MPSVAPEAGPCPEAISRHCAGGRPSPRAKAALRHKHPMPRGKPQRYAGGRPGPRAKPALRRKQCAPHESRAH
eukprot:9139850-Alexandrium_andersonii.AAC.1